uniref:Uncharacterized protein n=1 Tax=Emiliania huxleyi TaxID=2903 RepID=A0A7S3WNS8_EMIHU
MPRYQQPHGPPRIDHATHATLRGHTGSTYETPPPPNGPSHRGGRRDPPSRGRRRRYCGCSGSPVTVSYAASTSATSESKVEVSSQEPSTHTPLLAASARGAYTGET